MTKLLLIFGLLLGVQTYATHLRGGYIQVRSISTTALTYEITVTLYANEVQGKAAADQVESLPLCLGDGTTEDIVRVARIYSADRSMSRSLYRTVHTYAGPGTYALATALPNRTNALNISTPDMTAMTLTTVFTTGDGPNQTPVVSLPETGFTAAVHQRLVFFFNTTDQDGDSLVYSLTRPLTQASTDICSKRQVPAYQYPNDLTGQGTFKLDRRTGNLVWDAPVKEGNYSVAATVAEYRNGNLISQTQVEVSLAVVDQPGTPAPLPPYEPALEGAVVTAVSDDPDQDATLSVFPNPVDDRLQVTILASNPTPATLELTDVKGRKLHELAFKRVARQHEQVIRMDSLTPGVYVIRAEVGGRSLVRKVVKR